jgi:hypothetical protein
MGSAVPRSQSGNSRCRRGLRSRLARTVKLRRSPSPTPIPTHRRWQRPNQGRWLVVANRAKPDTVAEDDPCRVSPGSRGAFALKGYSNRILPLELLPILQVSTTRHSLLANRFLQKRIHFCGIVLNTSPSFCFDTNSPFFFRLCLSSAYCLFCNARYLLLLRRGDIQPARLAAINPRFVSSNTVSLPLSKVLV